jgi:hypothetical protein
MIHYDLEFFYTFIHLFLLLYEVEAFTKVLTIYQIYHTLKIRTREKNLNN